MLESRPAVLPLSLPRVPVKLPPHRRAVAAGEVPPTPPVRLESRRSDVTGGSDAAPAPASPTTIVSDNTGKGRDPVGPATTFFSLALGCSRICSCCPRCPCSCCFCCSHTAPVACTTWARSDCRVALVGGGKEVAVAAAAPVITAPTAISLPFILSTVIPSPPAAVPALETADFDFPLPPEFPSNSSLSSFPTSFLLAAELSTSA
mmetsp:Transcript_21212/g.61733  ORF Transcript_21212/g.61733 Transcript_21212/m.61733 type:complete len:205 (+) Transcript_21212:2387-3001(+)